MISWLKSILKPRGRFITASRRAVAPHQWLAFLLIHPEEGRAAADAPLRYTAALQQQLERVNRAVNASITPTRDKGDAWTLSPQRGDCDDYAVTKRHHLRLSGGLPVGALRIAIVNTPSRESHCVLIVKTDQGDFVLDNLTDQVLRWDRCRHQLVKIATADPYAWAF